MRFDYSSLITDRSQYDVDRVRELAAKGWAGMTEEERTEWAAGMKGAYNAADLNRVNAACLALAEELRGYGYSVAIDLPVVADGRTEWVVSDIPTPAQLEAYLDNVSTLRAVLELPGGTPAVPADMVSLTAAEANDIERILSDIEQTIIRVVKSFARSNAYTFWSGIRPFPSADSDCGRTWAELDEMDTKWKNWQAADWYLLLYGNLKAEGVVE